MEEMARDYINYARQLSSNGCFNKSFDLYIMAFEKNPESKNLYEQEFQTVLLRFNDVLAAAGKVEDIFTNFGRAIKTFPDNIYLLNEIGKYLFKFGYYEESWCHFQKALKADSGFVNAEKNINSVKNLLVERWHYRMLNCKVRNESYRRAIHETIRPIKDSVIDIGTGTGLLALYAHECKPMVITACDASEVMTSIAKHVAQDLGIMDMVIINKMSTSMDYKDIGGKRSVLITEMFDAGLFGEHVLQTLTHGWEYLLNAAGRVMPSKAEFFVAGANCERLNLKFQLGEAAKILLNIPMLNIHILAYDETYDCEDVHFFRDLKYLTAPQSLIKVDFNDYDDIQDKLHRSEPFIVDLNVIEDGEINTMVGWFNLYLTENITITTNPMSRARSNAWQQAVFFDFLPTPMKKNETYTAQFLMNTGKLTMMADCNKTVERISQEALRFLNDTELMKMITGCIGMACVYLGQIIEIDKTTIADLCPFPLFGMQMLKRGAQSLLCYAKTYEDEVFINKVFIANDLDMAKVTILVGEEWTQDSFKDEKFHAIICNIFELCGEIDLKQKEVAHQLKNSHLVSGGLFMPFNITLIGQLVDSHWLDINNRVYDENTHKYKISEYMNKYQVSQNFCIDISNLDYNPITDVVSLGEYTTDLGSEVINVPVVNDGEANAILCWYKIELMEHLGEISTNRSNAYIDCMAFLAYPKVAMKRGNIANVLRCVDPDGSFKLMIDVDTP
ncbi:protein arginine N-methyltransferase 9-like [Battus philenor]|uniref:protein arginine N-methyltransferase 9-like n=1 Tax=Battus philenor TaxID=42288 RepID=UPI0035CFC9A6